MPQDGLSPVADPLISDPAQQSTDLLDRSRRLNEYYNQVVAELRASLAEIGEGEPS